MSSALAALTLLLTLIASQRVDAAPALAAPTQDSAGEEWLTGFFALGMVGSLAGGLTAGRSVGVRRRRRVLIIQSVLKQYREPLFERMQDTLALHGVDLEVAFSPPNAVEALRGDNAETGGRYAYKVPGHWFFQYRLLYQPLWRRALRADMVVVEQANKYVMNYPLLLLARLGLKRVAFWGHGRDRRTNPHSLGEQLKRRLVAWPQWWFPYTDGCASEVTALGANPKRTSVLRNSIDTRGLAKDVESLRAEEIAQFRAEHALRPGDRIAIFCGSLYVSKALGFLMEAASRIAAKHPEFRLIVLGNGPARHVVENAVGASPWLRYLGPRFGRDKALAFATAEMVLNPGAVGLGILDAFCTGRAFIAAEHPHHSPEVEYLRPGRNGLMLAAQLDVFCSAVCELLEDPERLQAMSRAAREDANLYTVEGMADRFSAGILACLSATSTLRSPALEAAATSLPESQSSDERR